MKQVFLTVILLGVIIPRSARAVEPIAAKAPDVAALAKVTPFIVDTEEPQGLVLDDNDDILVCDYAANEVVRFDSKGVFKKVENKGLKGPSGISFLSLYNQETNTGERLFRVSECGANRVIDLEGDGPEIYGDEIKEPGDLMRTLYGGYYVISRAAPQIYWQSQNRWNLVYQAPDFGGKCSVFGGLASDQNTLFVSDETNGNITMISLNGYAAKFAEGFEKPTGMEVRGDCLYVCDEGNGGQLWKVSKNGVKILAARDLGRPGHILFLDDQTALVSDRNGRVLKLSWAE